MLRQEIIRHAHVCCGSGVGASGFNQGEARVGNLTAKFKCIGGVDVDRDGLRDFEMMTGVAGTHLDLFTLEDYVAFHGKQPPPGWREALPSDFHRAFNFEQPDIVFMSAPCKGLSGLLSEAKATSDRYQALNRLALRAVFLTLEAYKDDPVPVLLFENVPRIQTRGRHLLDQIVALLEYYGYAVAETTHDCGELGELAQSRKRFLLIARHREKVPPFIYEPPKRPLRAVGEVLGRLPMPGDPAAGPMHAVPRLHWKTWVRLAFVEAGKDWRSLNRLAVENGYLRDFAIAAEANYQAGVYGVNHWEGHANTIPGRSTPSNGNHSVADPRLQSSDYSAQQYGVTGWEQTAKTMTSQRAPGQGRFAIADPRIDGHDKSIQNGVLSWEQSSPVITSKMHVGGGSHSVADPRYGWEGAHENKMRVSEWESHARTVTGSDRVGSGAMSVADPRLPGVRHNNVYRIIRFEQNSAAVTAGKGPTAGGVGVADPRYGSSTHSALGVAQWDRHTRTVAGDSLPSNGQFAVSDPRPGLAREQGDNYASAGHYGVIPWERNSNVISAQGQHDNGFNSVADPRLPAPTDRLVCVIRSLDNTWHRPFTTLDCAALQSLFDPDDYRDQHFVLAGTSDSAWRERIGNAVPRQAARAIAGVIGHAILLARLGETFALGSTPIWVRPVAIALSVDPARAPA